MRKIGRLLIVVALVAVVVVVARSNVAWADFTADVASNPAEDNPAKSEPITGVFQGTVPTSDDIVTISVETITPGEPVVVGNVAQIEVDELEEGQGIVVSVTEDSVGNGLEIPAVAESPFEGYENFDDLPDFPIEDDDLLTPPITVQHSQNGGYVEEGAAAKICFPVPPGETGTISFIPFDFDGTWGDEVELTTTIEQDENGNDLACADASQSGAYAYKK